MPNNLSIIINSGNEQQVIGDCLRSALFADEIIFVAANSTDNTIRIVKDIAPQAKIFTVFDSYGKNFAKWHNIGLRQATKNWVFHLDADERITPKLKTEIIATINHPCHTYYAIPRANYFLGKRVLYGGTYPDYVKRLFLRSKLKKWSGKIHEEPQIDGEIGYLQHSLIHLTHRDLASMLQKSILWTDVEAQALHQDRHPPVVWWRILRMMFTKLWHRLLIQSMWRDGVIGWVSVIFETFDTYMIYSRLWEIQHLR